MASIFRSNTTSVPNRRSTDAKSKLSAVKNARAFWETQVRSSKVVQVRRGSAEHSFPGSAQGNESDGASVSSMDILGDDHPRLDGKKGDVLEAEAAINKMIREIRNELEIMHQEDADISLRLATLQGEISSLEDEFTDHGFPAMLCPVRPPEPVSTSSKPYYQAPSSVTGNGKSSSLDRNQRSMQNDQEAENSDDEMLRKRRDSVREKRVASSVKFKRVNSYHGLHSARVVLKPMAPAESVDRLEWNKPHLWPAPNISNSLSGSGSSSAYQSESGDASFDSAYDQDRSRSPVAKQRRDPAVATSETLSQRSSTSTRTTMPAASPRSSTATNYSAGAMSPRSSTATNASAGALSPHSSTATNVTADLMSPVADCPFSNPTSPMESASSGYGSMGSSISTPSAPASASSPMNSSFGSMSESEVRHRQQPSAFPNLSDDLRTRAVSGIHSDEIVAMYLERESSLRSELGLVQKKAKMASLTRSFARKSDASDASDVKPNRDSVFRRSGSFRRSTERVDSSIASSSSFRSSLRRRNSAHLSSASEINGKADPPLPIRPKNHSTTVNTFC